MLTPTETLDNLRDSIINAALKYQDGDVEIRFATTKQVQALVIALGKIVPETKAAKGRALRIALLAEITGRDPRFFRSSKDLTIEEATALIDRIYETMPDDTASLAFAALRPETVSAIQCAYAHVKERQHA